MSNSDRHPLEDMLKNDPEAAKAYDALSVEEQKTFWHSQEQAAGYLVPDKYRPDILHEVPRIVTTAKFSIKIGNETFYGNSPEELSANSQDAIVKQIEAGNAARAAAGDVVARSANGRFAKQPSATDGLDQITNNLVTQALEDAGLSVDELKDVAQHTRQDRKDVSSWAQATQDFLKASPDYPGGEDMKNRMSKRVIELGLVNYPSAASFRKAYDSLVAEDNLAEAVKDVTDPQQMRELLGITGREQDRLRNGWNK